MLPFQSAKNDNKRPVGVYLSNKMLLNLPRIIAAVTKMEVPKVFPPANVLMFIKIKSATKFAEHVIASKIGMRVNFFMVFSLY